RGLYDAALEQGTSEVGGILLSPSKKYTLGMVPPLLASQWYSLRDQALKQGMLLSEADLYCTVSYNDHRVSPSDRQLVRQFLKRWKHPLANWFSKGDVAAASTIDQINKLRNMAAHAENFLYDWQFELLRQLVVGDATKAGILQALV
ncbi:MAG: single-stranded-DNA-specific exonuclease RecJ, partial [Cyanobacteria bacterium]|nr:single-stranded-DNA-specific exonuclease RecJ [Cyanobacteriota bacterium]MDW8203077.1 single-stranded-DNA-specific exonuclease RecJ [Cyanobacteriota bacterium SKYGB_h_bin112]